LSWRRDCQCPPPSESSIWAALAGDLRRGYIVARQPESPAAGPHMAPLAVAAAAGKAITATNVSETAA
jgi:hypothetical protein